MTGAGRSNRWIGGVLPVARAENSLRKPTRVAATCRYAAVRGGDAVVHIPEGCPGTELSTTHRSWRMNQVFSLWAAFAGGRTPGEG